MAAAVTGDTAGGQPGGAARYGNELLGCLVRTGHAMAEHIGRVRPDLSSWGVVRPHPISVASIARRPGGPVILCPVLSRAEAAAMGLSAQRQTSSEEKDA